MKNENNMLFKNNKYTIGHNARNLFYNKIKKNEKIRLIKYNK